MYNKHKEENRMDFPDIIKTLGNCKIVQQLLDFLGKEVVGKEFQDFEKGLEHFQENIKKDDNIPQYGKSLILAKSRQIFVEYINKAKVVEKTISYLDKQDLINAQCIDVDWLTMYFNEVAQISTEEFQDIWARILASQIKQTSSVPKRLLQIVKQMEREDAENFIKLCSLSLKYDDGVETDIIPYHIPPMEKYYKDNGITTMVLVNLEGLGLIKSTSSSFTMQSSENARHLSYHGQDYELKTKNEFCFGSIVFTGVGEILYNLIDVMPSEDFFAVASKYFEKPLLS